MSLRNVPRGVAVLTVAISATLFPQQASAYPPVPAAITAYTTGNNGDEFVIYADHNGNLYGLVYASGEWSGAYGGYEVSSYSEYSPGSPLLSYADSDYNGRLFYIGLEGDSKPDLVEQRPYEGYNQNLPYGSPVDLTATYGASGWSLANTNGNGYEAYDDYYIPYGVYAPSPLLGFLDPNGYSHVYYNAFNWDYVNEIREMYTTSDSWTDHQIGTPNTGYLATTNMTALWDPAGFEEIYANVGGSLTNTSYPNGGNWTTATVTSSYTPTGFLASMSVSSTNSRVFVWGEEGTSAYQSFWVYDYPDLPGWTGFTAAASKLSYTTGAFALNWTDGSGADGGVFFVGSDQNVWLAPYGNGPINLTGGSHLVATNVVQNTSPMAGFVDTYQGTLHCFYVDQSGYVDELYLSASEFSESAAWEWHSVGGLGTDAGIAAH